MGRIKGVTIEYGGDTVKLENALKNVNNATKNVQSKLKDINKLLKYDPKNVELLRQKQEQLGKAIKTSGDKLEQLKKIENEISKDPGQKEKWEIIKREIAETEQQLKSYEKQQRKLNEEMSLFKKVGDHVIKVGDGFEQAGKKLVPVTAGITAIGYASKKAWDEIDEMLDIIVTKTGETGDGLKELQEVAKQVFRSEVAPSAVDAGNAVGELNTRFGFAGNILRDASIDFLKFAKVTGQDVNTAVISVSRAMGDAGIDSKNYKLVLDELTVAGQKSGIEVGKLTETLTKFGAPMRQLGFDIKESIALFATWEKAGVNTDIAFSGLKKSIGNWAKEGKDAKVEFRKMLDEIQKAPNLADATSKAIEVFGQKAGPDLADAIKGGRFEFSEMLKALEESSGSLETTFENTRDPIDKMKQAFNNIKIAGWELAEVAMQVLAPVFQNLANKIKALSEWFSKLTDKQKEMIVKILGIVAAIAPTLIVIGKMTKGVGKLIDSFKKFPSAMARLQTAGSKLAGGMSKLFSLISAHPFVAIGLAIAGLVAGIIYAYKHSEKFRNIVNKVLKSVSKAFEQFMVVVKRVWDVIQPTIQFAWDNVINPVLTYIKEKIEVLKQAFEVFSTDIVNIWNTVWSVIDSLWQAFWGTFEPIFTQAWTSLWTTIQLVWDNFWAIFQPIFNAAWEVLKVYFTTVFNAMQVVFSTVWEVIKTVFDTILGVIKGIWDVFAGAMTGDWTRVWNGIKGIASSIWEGIKGIIKTVITGIYNTVKSIVTDIYNAVSEWFGKIPSKVSEVWNNALSYLKGINLYSIGRDIIWGLINGVGSMAGALWNKAQEIGRSFVSSIKSFFGIASPSKVMKGFGVNVGEGLIVGVENMKSKVAESGRELSGAFTEGYESRHKNFKNTITGQYNLSTNSNVISRLNDVVKDFNALKNNMSITVNSVLDGKVIAQSTWKYTDNYQGSNLKRLRSVRV